MSRNRDHEKLDDPNLASVLAALGEDKPITKKEACARLNITYNTTRLGKILDQYQARIEADARIRKSLRGTPLSQGEKRFILEQYVTGESVTEVSKSTHRSRDVINRFLTEQHIPKIGGKSDYFKNVPLIPEEAIREHYEKEDLVFAARYNCLALIVSLFKVDRVHGEVYSVYLLGNKQERAYQPFYELGNLTHLQKEFGIQVQGEAGRRPRELR